MNGNCDILLEMIDITKRFGPVLANDRAALKVRKGEIHAIVGENGAGKSTLMKALYGLVRPDSGSIRLRGRAVNIASPGAATRLGIGMVHQHFMLIDRLTVAENLVLGLEPRGSLRTIDLKKAFRAVRDLAASVGFELSPDDLVADLSVGARQRLEIMKVLYRGAELIVLDEPTAVLTPQEAAELFKTMRRLKRDGKTIIFITHKLSEVMELSDRVTVMRSGRVAGVVDTGSVTPSRLAEMMVGRPLLEQIEKSPFEPGEVILEVRDLYASDAGGAPRLQGIDLQVRAGEIFGIAGVEGNGQRELVEVLNGLRPAARGEVLLGGRQVLGESPRQIRDRSVAHIPEDRHHRGLLLDFTLSENALLGLQHRQQFSRIWLQMDRIRQYTRELVAQFDIRTPGIAARARQLSGGNQQKLIVAREVHQDPRLLIAAQPTRGVDVGSVEFIHQQLIDLRSRGKAILLVSADLEEILGLSDTVSVIFRGKIVGQFPAGQADERTLGLLMMGQRSGGDEQNRAATANVGEED
jgi:simple sugar transport system ATP-binding protein